MLRNKCMMQGATWMYEAIVGPTFQLILKEAVKIPSIDRLVNQTDLVCPTFTMLHLTQSCTCFEVVNTVCNCKLSALSSHNGMIPRCFP